MPATNEAAKFLLRECYERLRAFATTMYEGEHDVTPQLAFTIGVLMGSIHEGLAAEAENRPVRHG